MQGILILLDQAGTAIAELQQRVRELEAENAKLRVPREPAVDGNGDPIPGLARAVRQEAQSGVQ